MAECYLMGVDIGTSQSKGVLCDPKGNIIAQHATGHGVEMPCPGWYEHDVEAVWWADFVKIAGALLQKSGIDPRLIKGVCASGLGQDVVPVNSAGVPTRKNAILYGIDTRALAEMDEMERRFGPGKILQKTANALSTHSVGPKIAWLKNHEPEAYEKAACFLTASSYLVSKLTGAFVLDHNQASFWVPLYDFDNHCWNEEMCAPYVDVAKLPQLKWEYEVAGGVTPEAARQTGLARGTPVCVGAGDAFAESLSVGALAPGEMMAMYGSTTCLFMPVASVVPDARVWSYRSYRPATYGVSMCTASSGSITKWFKNNFAREFGAKSASEAAAYDALTREAIQSPPGAKGLLLLPYFSGERSPLYDSFAKGVIHGLTLEHSRGDLFRAVCEGIAYSIRHNLAMLQSLGQTPKKLIAVGGGVKNEVWLSAVSDICGMPQSIPEVTIGASYADAYIAGIAAGLFDSVEGISSWVHYTGEVRPRPDNKKLYDEGFEKYLQLYQNTKFLNPTSHFEGESQ